MPEMFTFEGREYDLADEAMVKGLSEEDFGRLLAAILAADHADALAGRPQPSSHKNIPLVQRPEGTAIVFPPLPAAGVARRQERVEARAAQLAAEKGASAVDPEPPAQAPATGSGATSTSSGE